MNSNEVTGFRVSGPSADRFPVDGVDPSARHPSVAATGEAFQGMSAGDELTGGGDDVIELDEIDFIDEDEEEDEDEDDDDDDEDDDDDDDDDDEDVE